MCISFVAGTFLTVDGGGVDPAQPGRRDELAVRFRTDDELHPVLQREGDVDVADRALRVRDDARRRRSCRGRHWPAGQLTLTPSPTFVFHSGLTAAR